MNTENYKIGRLVRLRESDNHGQKEMIVEIAGRVSSEYVAVCHVALPHIVDKESIERWQIVESYRGNNFCRFYIGDLCLRIKR